MYGVNVWGECMGGKKYLVICKFKVFNKKYDAG